MRASHQDRRTHGPEELGHEFSSSIEAERDAFTGETQKESAIEYFLLANESADMDRAETWTLT